MKIKVLIVEDNPITSQDLLEIMTERGICVTKVAKNINEAVEAINEQTPDILLVDINLKGGDDGVEFVKKVSKDHSFPVVYLTANSDKFTVERALSTKPVSFLTKPYDERDVVIAIELAFNNHCLELVEDKTDRVAFIFLKSGSQFEKVRVEEILFLKAEGSYTKFVTEKKEYTLSNNLHQVTGKLSNPSFLRTHRSYVVNVNSVKGIDSDNVFIHDFKVPISRSYKESVNKYLRKIS